MYNPLGPGRALIWDIIATIISVSAVMAVVQINGLIQKKGLLPTNVTRKIVHIMAAPVFMATWPLYTGAWYCRYLAMLVPTVFVVMFYAIGTGKMEDEAFVRSMSRSGDPAELLKGTLYYAALLWLVTVVWFYLPTTGLTDANPTALILFGCLAGGDGLADVIGRRYGGKFKFGFGGAQKTLMGTWGMFAGSVLFCVGLVFVFSLEAGSLSVGALMTPILILSVLATIVEVCTPGGYDNITIVASVLLGIIVISMVAPAMWPYALTTL